MKNRKKNCTHRAAPTETTEENVKEVSNLVPEISWHSPFERTSHKEEITGMRYTCVAALTKM